MSEKAVVKILSAEDILSADDIKTVEVEVPEWGGTVLLRAMSAEESLEFWESNKEGDKKHGAVNMAAACIVDAEGNKVFTTEQVKLLAKKSLAALMRIQRVALDLNGLSPKKETEAKND